MSKWYAYALPSGRKGVIDSWEECWRKTSGVSGAKFKAFKEKEAAKEWLLDSAVADDSGTIEPGIYFDAGTGRGDGVEVRVTDHLGHDLLSLIIPKDKLTMHGTLLLKGRTNNFGELKGLFFALEVAARKGVSQVFGDSRLVLDYWSKGSVKLADEATSELVEEVTRQRKEFEKKGGKVGHVSGDANPADLGFHQK